MKKLVSLVLVLAMTLSLVTVSAGAKDFTDDSEIQYKEAVDVMSAVHVVDGYADGDFRPQGTLTRGAAAKIICNMILGPTTADALSANSAPFGDVPADHVFAGYIAFCAKEGIINGYADGTFRPSGTLTGYAFMKMLLGALGYDADIEGYTGSNWTINVAKQALDIELDDGNNNFVGTKPVTREEACLYAFNALQATMVEYDSKTTVEVNGATVNVGNQDAEDEEWSGGKGSGDDGKIERDGLVQFAEKYFEDLKKVDSTETDDFGRPATEWKYKSDSIGTYVDYGDLVYTATAAVARGDAYDLIGKDAYDDLEDENGETLVKVYVDGEKTTDYTLNELVKKDSTDDVKWTGRGIQAEMYLDDDYGVNGDQTMITLVFITTYLVQATADYNDAKEEVNIEFIDVNDAGDLRPANFPNYIEQEDFDVSDVVEDDYLLVTFADGDIQSVAKAELLEGEVDTYKYNDSVTIGGEKYKYNAICKDKKSGSYPNGAKGEEFSVGDTAILVMDSYGYIMYVDDANAGGNYVYIEEFGAPSGLNKTAIASAYFTDGTSDEIEIDEVTLVEGGKIGNSSTIASWKESEAGWYTYTKNSSDEYDLKAIELKYADSDVLDYYYELDDEGEILDKQPILNNLQIIDNESVKFLTGMDSKKANIKADEDTVFIVLDEDDDIDVYTGLSNAPDITLTTVGKDDHAHVGYINDDGYATYVFVDLNDVTEADIDDATSSDDYMFILYTNGKVNRVSDDKDYIDYDVVMNGAVTSVRVNDGDEEYFKEGTLVNELRTNSDEYLTKAETIGNKGDKDEVCVKSVEKDAAEGKPIKHSNGTLTMGDEEYILSKGASINLIVDGNDENKDLLKDDGADFETYLNISGSALAGYLHGYDATYDYYAVLDDDDSAIVDVLYVWVTQAIDSDVEVEDEEDTVDTEAVKAVADAIKAIGSELEVTVTEAKSSAVKTEVEKAIADDVGACNATVSVRSFTAVDEGSTTTAEVKVTVTSGDYSDYAMVTVYVTVEA